MANRMNFCVKSLMFSYIIFCAQRHSIALEDVEYSIDNPSKLDDISVIEFGGRFRRQANDPTVRDHTEEATTPKNPNVVDDTGFGTKLFPEEYDVRHDDHKYYKMVTFDAKDISKYYIELDRAENHDALSDSYRTAATATLPFNFSFYGHVVKQVTIATGGFLYMSPFLHQWLTATQYIAPLMANFDLSVGNESDIFYQGFETAPRKFVVEWKNVYLQDQKDTGSFQFQAHLYENGSIFFVYKKLPVTISNISSKAHPVKIGLSDAFYYDTTAQGVKRRTIYEYHRVPVNLTTINEGTIVVMMPNPTCNLAKDCESCISQNISFNCKWCGIAQRCSDGVDWYRQAWLRANCLHYAGNVNCSLIPVTLPPTPAPKKQEMPSSTIAVIVVVVVIIVALLGAVGGWFYYAYSNPTSASGMWLMEHRPSQMKAKLNTMKFWKKSESAGDKYAVESNA